MMEKSKRKKLYLNNKKRPRHNCVSWHNDTIVYPDTILKNKKNIIKNKKIKLKIIIIKNLKNKLK